MRPGGRALVALLASAALALAGCGGEAHPKNAVLVVLDTLRADRVSAYGHTRKTTPAIDGLAARGVLFENAITNAPWTLPAMAGLLAGDYPTRRVYHDGLRASVVAHLRDAGFRTVAFTEGGFVSQRFGLDRGFDRFEDQGSHPFREVAAGGDPEAESSFGGIDVTFEKARRWLEEEAREPFFLLVHTYETHTPYERHDFTEGLDSGIIGPIFLVTHAAMAKIGHPLMVLGPTELAWIGALYDGGVATADRHVGGLLETLAATGLADSTLVVVTSDHGEDLGERIPRWPGTHGHALWEELVRVPLVLRDPTRDYPVRRVTPQVRSIDVLPTIADLLGAPPLPERHGRSLVPLMMGEERAPRPAWTRVEANPTYDRIEQLGLRRGRYKLVLTPSGADAAGRVALYDLEEDPGETRDVAEAQPATRDAMLAELRALRDELGAEGFHTWQSERALPDDAKARLRELGYAE